MPSIALLLALTGCSRELEPEPTPTWHFQLDEAFGAEIQAAAHSAGGRTWLAVDDSLGAAPHLAQLAMRDGERGAFGFVARGDLPPGVITFLGAHDASREWLFAHVHGAGFFRGWAGSGVWTPVELRSPLVEFLAPHARPIPTDLAVAEDGVLWLATLGGLFYSSDEGATWSLTDLSSAGGTNIAFTGVAARNGQVVAVSALPDSLIPSGFDGILSGRVFVSTNSGLTWSLADAGFPSHHPTSVALDEVGRIYVGTMDEGVVRGRVGDWTPLYGPTDVRDLAWSRGGLHVASATRGLWRLQDPTWSQVGQGPGVLVAGDTAVARDGDVWTLAKGEGEPAPLPHQGQVHIALSFHVNYYHSYRGDSNTEDGFGRDIRIIRTALDWLDERPFVRADWDFDNAFSTEGWMPDYSPDILERVQARVADGRDSVRLMSWNNGAMASSNRAEFDLAIERAWDANQDRFGRVVAGVQPQENMFSPDHIAWYPEAGVEWVTLFYGANGFTGPRNDLRLSGLATANPINLQDPVTGSSMVMVPVYHHADLLDHGGLRGWVRQLSAAHPEDTLLVIHFDADGDSWERFDREIDAVADLPFVHWTTIDSYLVGHDPVANAVLPGDVADGVGDGFSSWSEKTVNHEVWTPIEASRRLAAVAALVGAGHGPTQSALQSALEPRLLALSTTHFGLATPALHPDRALSARAHADEALRTASDALAIANAAFPLDTPEIEVVNPRAASGLALIPVQLALPVGTWQGEAGLTIERGGAQFAFVATASHVDGEHELIDVLLRADVAAQTQQIYTWQYDAADPQPVSGSLTAADVPVLPNLLPPLVECAGQPQVPAAPTVTTEVGSRGLRASRTEAWRVPTCGGLSSVRRTLTRLDGFDGVYVDVEATIDPAGDPDQLSSIALTPFVCPGGIDSLRWLSYGGQVRQRAVPPGLHTWNPVSSDGWVEATCGSGERVQIAVDTTVRSTMGLLTLRNQGPDGLLAPLGTLWGSGPWHDAPRTGGLGLADHITPMVGSQFTPSAPGWSGAQVRYRLRIAADLDVEALELSAHPPYARVAPKPSTPGDP